MNVKENMLSFVLTAILVVTISVEGLLLGMEKKISNRQVLYYQLQAIRTSINLFKAIEKRNPTDFKELSSKIFQFPGESLKRHYLEGVPLDKNGVPLDPFGEPYKYDPHSGWARAGSLLYVDW